MCTAVTYKTNDFYFGRTLDYEFSYGDEITVTPRNYPFSFRNGSEMKTHFAIIGMAYVCNDYPLYYDAVNEKGLCIAGLNFVGNAFYRDAAPDKDNITQFELIPWILGQCGTVGEARSLLEKINITNIPFSENLPVSSLHWMISDKTGSLTLESVKDGIRIYDNPVGALTNNPPFDIQMFNLTNYMKLSAAPPENKFSDKVELKTYSRGMGALGLPGDLSSMSRFVRAAFTKMNSVSGSSEAESVSQFFHILGSVDQQRGCCILDDGKCEITLYTSCCNADKGIYYYNTYENHQISAVDMHKEDLDGSGLVRYKPVYGEQVNYQN
ncbi:MAG: choloylglycine hydrolase [Alistipes sp.]|nr:choloylglycine hydrolase [Alistipes sp.]